MKGLVNIFIPNYIGNLFQVSNQTTLGEKEEDIINRLAKVIEQIIGHEQAARETLLEKKRTMLIDQVGRAYGILRNAAHLQKNSQQKLSAEKRDALRADIVRAKLRTFPMPNMFQAPAEPGGNGNGDAN